MYEPPFLSEINKFFYLFSARERAEFRKSCNLIGSWSVRSVRHPYRYCGRDPSLQRCNVSLNSHVTLPFFYVQILTFPPIATKTITEKGTKSTPDETENFNEEKKKHQLSTLRKP